VTKETLSDLERARRKPHPPTLAKIADGYGIEIGELLGPMVEELVPAGKAETPTSGHAAPPAPTEPASVKEDLRSLTEAPVPRDEARGDYEQLLLAQLAASRQEVSVCAREMEKLVWEFFYLADTNQFGTSDAVVLAGRLVQATKEANRRFLSRRMCVQSKWEDVLQKEGALSPPVLSGVQAVESAYKRLNAAVQDLRNRVQDERK
jgi:transcriptional regulator with XRE-family HTH domain